MPRGRSAAGVLLVATFALFPVAALAQAVPSFALPIDCVVGRSCIIQNYVDRDPGPGASDYRCGFLTYDGHKGTDIRVIDARALRDGVAVLAAAPGRVRAIRDGMADVSVKAIGKQAIAGREAGNSVVIVHGGGWETQYAHMRRGSVAVRPGDVVAAGARLGVVGLSGDTEFPHVHFEIRYRGKTVDPFVGLAGGEPCTAGKEPLWQARTAKALAYAATGVLGAGIAGGAPVTSDDDVDLGKTARFGVDASAAVFWVQIYGARDDDVEELRLIAPDGRLLAEHRDSISRNRAQWISYAGARARGAWLTGTYRGEYALYRGERREKVLSFAREITLAPGSS